VSIPRQRRVKTKRAPKECHNVPELLRELNADAACVQKQAAVLRVWLRAHPPGHDLRVSLLSNGYGHILDEAVGRPPRTPTMKNPA
jgi:hypothetical protein